MDPGKGAAVGDERVAEMQQLGHVLLHESYSRRLKKVRQQLFHDLLALASGLRDAIMLDYVVAPPEALSHLLLLLAGVPSLADAQVLQLGGCLYLAKLADVLKRVPKKSQTLSDAGTLPIAVVIDGADARFATAGESTSFHAQLDSFAHGLASASDARSRRGDGAWVDLESLLSRQALPLPSINGWLLGYPVVYLFQPPRGAEAARCLSSCQLRLYHLQARCCLSLHTPPGLSGPEGGEAATKDVVKICSFSIAASLSHLQAEEAWAKSFMSAVLRKWTQTGAGIWGVPELVCSLQGPRAIVL